MNPFAYDVFPSVEPAKKQRPASNYCVLLGKEVEDRPSKDSFCLCGKCICLYTPRETICCRETLNATTEYSKNIAPMLTNHDCLSDHPIIQSIVGNQLELELFQKFGDYWKAKGNIFVDKNLPSTDPNRYLRFAAYSKLTMFLHDKLGLEKRVELPSCLIHLVRDSYPNPEGVYVGFQEASWHVQ